MNKKNSGKIFRFKLDHSLGFGFAEMYDFSDTDPFDGCLIYVYNRYDQQEEKEYNLEQITAAGIALGPIRLNNFPNTRGQGAWKLLFQTNKLMITEIPETKELRGLIIKDDNWDNLQDWYGSNYNTNSLPIFLPYEKLRHLETRILNANTSIATKFTMKVLLDKNVEISKYYDLKKTGNRNLYVQLVNTYYSLNKAKKFLKQIP